jgi:hypothetical protein
MTVAPRNTRERGVNMDAPRPPLSPGPHTPLPLHGHKFPPGAAAGRGEAEVSRNLQCERYQVGLEFGPTSALDSRVPTGMYGPTCIFWANLTTPFSLTYKIGSRL